MADMMRWFSRGLAAAVIGVLLLSATPNVSAQRRVVVVRPFWGWGWGPGPYWYPYGPYGYGYDSVSSHYGFIKFDAHHENKNASVFVDGGFASRVKDAGKLALRPGNHDIEVRDSDGRTIFQERVAVTVGRTTKLDIPS